MFTLRPFQAAALQAMNHSPFQGNHVLCVAPTGSGKSLIYEQAASLDGRRTLLITPLVALARQQFKKLKTLGIPVSLGAGGVSENPPNTKTGAWIISPEMLNFPSRHNALTRWKPNLLVVDECHCLWEWGESFRPSFTLIPELLQKYSILQSLWLTATLPFEARSQIRQLLPQPLIEIGHFELPKQLLLYVQQVGWENRAQTLLSWVLRQKGAGIIFVPTREATLRVSRLIEATGKKVLIYHGGMSREERKNAESLVSQNIHSVIVATSAFGMGMDYPHLTYVVLWQAPTSLLSLVQTIGRVGRNIQKKAHALVLWDHDDFRLLEWTVQHSPKRRQELADLFIFFKSNTCRTFALKRYFDRITHCGTCGQCDICLKEAD